MSFSFSCSISSRCLSSSFVMKTRSALERSRALGGVSLGIALSPFNFFTSSGDMK